MLMKLLNKLLENPDLTPLGRNAAMKRLLAMPVEEPQREVPDGEMEVSCGS